MGKYDFIKTGNLLYWHDPDNGLSDGAYRVISAPENMEDDSIILISSGTSEAEVLPSELLPISRFGRRRHGSIYKRLWSSIRPQRGVGFQEALERWQMRVS